MKVYISGKITGLFKYKENFKKAEDELISMGHTVLNPAIAPAGLKYNEYMHISYAMIDISDALYMLKDWESSKGANLEIEHANKLNKLIFFEEE